MKTSNITKYKDLLNHFEFEKLENELLSKPFEEMEYYLNQMAYDTKSGESNLLVYTFLLMMIVENETPTMHLLVSRLMGTGINFIKDAEKIGLYHGMRAVELDPENIDILEYLLYFHHIPERLLDDSTAIFFAEKVLEKYPDSLAAKMTLAKAQG